MSQFSTCLGLAVALTALAAAPALAETVSLTAKDGSTTLTGDLVSTDGGEYLVEVPALGRLRIPQDLVTCAGAGCPSDWPQSFGIHGSRTVGTTLVPNLLRGYAASFGGRIEIEPTDDPAARIVHVYGADGALRFDVDLQTRGSGSAFTALGQDAAEIGLADRRMKDSDLPKLAAGGVGDLRDTAAETVLGVDGIVLITHPDNPVPNLSGEEVAAIWSGEITNWRQLGGDDLPIQVNSFGEGSGDRAVLLDGLVRPYGRDETAEVTRWSAYQDLVDAVMAEPGAIGFVGRWLARTNDVNLLAIREPCGLLSPPTDFRMKIEGYALSRRLYAYTNPGPMHPEARAFLDWTLTPEAQAYVKESHFIDQALERMRLEDMGMMLIHTAAVEPDFDGAQFQSMMRQLRHTDRLSTSFRFRTGSSILDDQSLRYLEDFARRVERGDFAGFEVLLVGFADSVGQSAKNTALAARRAEAVRDQLLQVLSPQVAAAVPLTPLSFGEQMPLSCNDTPEGRERNRRVEVWLRLLPRQTG